MWAERKVIKHREVELVVREGGREREGERGKERERESERASSSEAHHILHVLASMGLLYKQVTPKHCIVGPTGACVYSSVWMPSEVA